MRVAFDIGGVLSKWPTEMIGLMNDLWARGHTLYVLTDMHDMAEIIRTLGENGIGSPVVTRERILSADYATHGEACKAVLMKEHRIDMLFDDFIGYTVWPYEEPAPMRFLLMPDARRPYWHPSWKVPGKEQEFGRRVFTAQDTP